MMFGNTEAIARSVAEGLSGEFEVTVAEVWTGPRPSGVDLLVVGGPTHAFDDPAGDPPGRRASGRGRRCRNRHPGMAGRRATAHRRGGDLRQGEQATGRVGGAHKAYRRLRWLGCRMIVPAESFHVSGTPGPLDEAGAGPRVGCDLAKAAVVTQEASETWHLTPGT